MDASDIPIDIHYNKLLDWLLNRRHCNADWQSECLVVRQKINNAIQDMPEHAEVRELLAGTYMNYFHCVRIVAILRDTEAASRNIFGRYSSQRMKDWQEVVRLYEKDDLYLGEAAQLLTRSVNYEIPALKKQIARCQQTQSDCSRKESEYASLSAEYKAKYTAQCKHMGIQGKQVKKELLLLVEDLPSTYDGIAAKARHLEAAVRYYANFITFTLNNSALGESSVALVRYMCSHGNTTVMEYRTGVKPTRVIERTVDYDVEDEEAASQEAEGEIDWGDLDSGGIDEHMTASSDEEVGAGIDWGEAGIESVDIQVIDSSSVPPTGDVIAGVPCWETSVRRNIPFFAPQDGVSRGEDALTILDNTPTRNRFVNDLIELRCFFTQRLQEMRSDDIAVSGNHLQSAPSSLQLDLVQVEKLKALVDDVYGELTTTRMQELTLIRGCPRYVDRLTDRLKALLSESEKMASLSRLMVSRREEARQEECDLHPKLDLVRQKMKLLKSQTENEISKKYKNRRVNIMGEINTI